MKKIFAINAAVCDTRKAREETLAPYDEIRINSALVLVSPASRALLGKYPVSVNTGSVLETEEDVRIVSVNGKHTLDAGTALPQGKCYLLVNGVLEAEPGCEALLGSYVGITVNGKVVCPKSMAGLFAGANINGKLEAYPDGCVRLKDPAVLDKTFSLRAREGARYYTAGQIVALDPGIDFDALAAKGVCFVTGKLLVAESLCEKAVPLFDEEADIVILPDGCAYVSGDAVLGENLLRRYGNRLYIDGSLTVNEESRSALDRIAFLKVNGDLRATRALAAAAAELKAEYDQLVIGADRILEDRGSLTVDRALLEAAGTLGIRDCGKVVFREDVSAALIGEKLVELSDCGTVVCTGEQRSAVELVAEDVGRIRESGQEAGEKTGDEEDKEIRRVNAANYVL